MLLSGIGLLSFCPVPKSDANLGLALLVSLCSLVILIWFLFLGGLEWLLYKL